MYCSHITTWREVRLRTCCPRPHTSEQPLRREVQLQVRPLQSEVRLRNIPSISTSTFEESETSVYSSEDQDLVLVKTFLLIFQSPISIVIDERQFQDQARDRDCHETKFFIKNRNLNIFWSNFSINHHQIFPAKSRRSF